MKAKIEENTEKKSNMSTNMWFIYMNDYIKPVYVTLTQWVRYNKISDIEFEAIS